MPYVVVTPSLNLPVSLVTALRHMRVLSNESDTVQLYVLAATEAVEDYTGRALLTKTYRLELPKFPAQAFIELRRTPLISIDNVKYYAPASTVLTTWDSANYRANTSSTPGRIEIVDGINTPDTEVRHDAVQIQFQAGQGTKEAGVDPTLRLAVLEFAHNCFDNRVPVGDVRMIELPYSLKHLLRMKKVESRTEQ